MKKEFKPLNVNINTLCRVKLTDHGIDILENKAPYKLSLSGWNENTKEFTTELWDLMEIFGSRMLMGNNKMPFENNNIQIMEEVL